MVLCFYNIQSGVAYLVHIVSGKDHNYVKERNVQAHFKGLGREGRGVFYTT